MSEPVEFSGYLTKRSMWLKEWRRRWFQLIGNKLYFSKAPGEPAHGTIDLSECLTVKSADEKTEKPHSFEVATPDQVYYMYAANEKEKDDWIGAIGRAIVRFSNAFTAEDGVEDEDEEDEDD